MPRKVFVFICAISGSKNTCRYAYNSVIHHHTTNPLESSFFHLQDIKTKKMFIF